MKCSVRVEYREQGPAQQQHSSNTAAEALVT